MSVILSEVEILDRIKSNKVEPLVTFLCITYNQEDYIEQSIIGFLKQKTLFPYEILIHDDSSTDGTRDIIESYRLRYPNIIRCIYQTDNKYSQGLSPILIAAKECKSDYIAICEGDDYWVNENKIQNQFDFMMKDTSISMVVSPGRLESKGKILSQTQGFYGPKSKVIAAQDILNISGQFAPTASYLIKKEYLICSMEFFIDAPVGDLFIELYSAALGKLVYFPEVSSVYRLASKNSFTNQMLKGELTSKVKFILSMEKAIEKSKKIEALKELDWSIKLSLLYYNLSILYIDNRDFEGFSRAIEKSYSYKETKGIRKLLIYCKGSKFLLFNVCRPLINSRKKYVSILKGI